MRLWQVYPACPRCKADAGIPCRDQRRGFEGRPRKNPCPERLRLLGGDRWAQAGEITCGAGGCRNLATWKLASDLPDARAWLSCNLHKAARIRLMIERKQARDPIALPFQDPTERPPGKTNRFRTEASQ